MSRAELYQQAIDNVREVIALCLEAIANPPSLDVQTLVSVCMANSNVLLALLFIIKSLDPDDDQQ